MNRLQRLLASLVTLAGLGAAQAAELAPGDLAPAFALKDQNNKPHTLADYRGRWVVLYFYPKDDTPGCTTEACNFRDDLPALRGLGVAILGISTDDTQSHERFAGKFSLPFSLLADTDGSVTKAYGSLQSLGPIRFAKRHSFIVAPDGRIAKIYRSVNPATHSRDVQRDVKELQKGGGTKPQGDT